MGPLRGTALDSSNLSSTASILTDFYSQKLGWGQVSGNHWGGVNSVSQVDGVSDRVAAQWLCGYVRGGLRKGTMTSASTLVWEKAVSLAFALMPDNSVLPVCL